MNLVHQNTCLTCPVRGRGWALLRELVMLQKDSFLGGEVGRSDPLWPLFLSSVPVIFVFTACATKVACAP